MTTLRTVSIFYLFRLTDRCELMTPSCLPPVSYKWIKGDLIGRGTYGHVYIALSVTTGETIAVKQVEMPRTYSDKEDQRTKGMISSLKAEIELLKDLDHPNIVLYLGLFSSLVAPPSLDDSTDKPNSLENRYGTNS